MDLECLKFSNSFKNPAFHPNKLINKTYSIGMGFSPFI
ncbi:hypothetical protein ADICYQ_1371 [Cyclobacterium qasimii M12-11B]|uniref:Uncharacterized protein n=1 Tax=Cyclobacterium qasimii M12-11B TaxID=641524 RepID=S7VHW7_9BACT|nr:hypothetical protein ADICYQ_1371 [Cyclobacterium qasimii M12-11B]